VQPLDIGGEDRPGFDLLEQHQEAKQPAKDHVRHREVLAKQEGPFGKRAFGRGHHRRMVAPAGRDLLHLPARALRHHGGLDDTRREERPAQVGAASGIVQGGREPARRVAVGQVQRDRRGLGHDDVAVDQRRQLAHRIDREEFGLLLRALHDVDDLQFVRHASLFQRPERAGRAGVRVIVEGQGHGGASFPGLACQRGMFPCLRHGFSSFLSRSITSERQMRLRVSCGRITSSMKPRAPATKGLAKRALYSASRAASLAGSPLSSRKMISTAPLAPITAISAFGQAKLTSPRKCLELITSYAPPWALRVMTVIFGTVHSAYANSSLAPCLMMPPYSCAVPGMKPGTSTKVTMGMLK